MPEPGTMPPIFRHSLRAFDPATNLEVEGKLDPEKRYNLEFTRSPEPVPYESLTYDERVKLQSPQAPQAVETGIPGMPEWQESTDVDDVVESGYESGRISIRRQYLDDMKIANSLPMGSQEQQVFAQEAAATMQARMAELNMNRNSAKQMFRQINQRQELTPKEKMELKTGYYEKNPIWRTPKIDYPSTQDIQNAGEIPPVQVQKVLGQLATDPQIADMQLALTVAASKLGYDFATKYPQAVEIINERAKTGFLEPLPITPSLMTPEAETEPEATGFNWENVANTASDWWSRKTSGESQAEFLRQPGIEAEPQQQSQIPIPEQSVLMRSSDPADTRTYRVNKAEVAEALKNNWRLI